MPQPITAPKGYVRSSIPILSGGDGQYLQTELQSVARSIASILVFTPCAAAQPPATLGDGMIRLSRSPWRPLSGQTVDTWVYYDAPTAKWVALP